MVELVLLMVPVQFSCEFGGVTARLLLHCFAGFQKIRGSFLGALMIRNIVISIFRPPPKKSSVCNPWAFATPGETSLPTSVVRALLCGSQENYGHPHLDSHTALPQNVRCTSKPSSYH